MNDRLSELENREVGAEMKNGRIRSERSRPFFIIINYQFSTINYHLIPQSQFRHQLGGHQDLLKFWHLKARKYQCVSQI